MLDALTLDQMRVLIAVTETGSFSGGAERLGRAQSAVSYAIRNLESQLDVTLFDRSGYRPVLTPEGRTLLADARAILLKVDTLRARARGLGEGVELRLDIALDPQFPLNVASRALKELQDAYPLVSVRVLPAPLGEAIRLLQQHHCTLAVSGIDIPDPRIEREAIAFVPRAAVVSACHSLANRAASGETITAAELADYVQIVTEDPSTLTHGREYDVLSTGTWRVGDNSTKHSLICAGIGWGNLPLWLIERDLLEGRLVRIPAAEFGYEGESVARMWLMRRTDKHLGPAAKTLREALLRQADTLGA
ncbi:LysR family transcriptional regulator [Vreelandella boliviensis]|jgi:DNA-binding transcriptional LysR family regulator|uniref:LysR family transcriptional regulator n=1 Tax=Vreelandella boliviensis TaxID=223527 RepID=UPI001B8C10DB|nr:LysR family transcriptional regulator [Halomonas boliviensis]MBS3666655.1 LysR family transcriptional regulator [Halomonas boliviensis]